MGFWLFNDGGGVRLGMSGPAPHTQVVPYFKDYDTSRPIGEVDNDYRSANNIVGHQQRAFVIYWALRGFTELEFVPGLDIGGAGVNTPGCISVDTIGTGDTPAYGGTYDGVHIKTDGSKLTNFGANSFSSVVSNHLVEHVVCDYFNETHGDQKARKIYGCDGHELSCTLDRWVEILRPGGYIAAITPDEKFMERTDNSFLFIDPTHQHAFDSRTFKDVVLSKVEGVELVRYDTLANNFSFDFVLRKK